MTMITSLLIRSGSIAVYRRSDDAVTHTLPILTLAPRDLPPQQQAQWDSLETLLGLLCEQGESLGDVVIEPAGKVASAWQNVTGPDPFDPASTLVTREPIAWRDKLRINATICGEDGSARQSIHSTEWDNALPARDLILALWAYLENL